MLFYFEIIQINIIFLTKFSDIIVDAENWDRTFLLHFQI